MTFKLPVLMYHALSGAGYKYEFSDPGELRYVIDADVFRKQMFWLRQHGFETVSFHDIRNAKNVELEKNVIITFDDGHASNLTIACPILKEFGFNATFFITTGWIGKANYLSSEDIRILQKERMEIGSHGVSHRYLDDLNDSDLLDELQSSKRCLEDIIGERVDLFSAPGGRIENRTINIGKQEGYLFFCTSFFGLWKRPFVPGIVPRLAIKRETSKYHFEKQINGDPFFFFYHGVRSKTLNLLKLLLGNRTYDRLWYKIHSLLLK